MTHTFTFAFEFLFTLNHTHMHIYIYLYMTQADTTRPDVNLHGTTWKRDLTCHGKT